MKNILVAVDFDGANQKLMDYAAAFSEKFGARLWILHIAAPDPDFVGYGVGPQYIRNIRAEDLREEHQFLQAAAEKYRSNGIETEALLVQGSTVESLLEEASKLEIDLLVIGTHAHGVFYRAFQEDTALEVFKKSKIPLLAVPLEN